MKRTLIAMLTLAMFVAMVPGSVVAVDDSPGYVLGEEFIVSDAIYQQSQIEFWGDIVVFRDRNPEIPHPSDCDMPPWSISAADLSTGFVFDVDLDDENANNPSVYGDHAVWKDSDNGIYGRDLTTGRTYVITDGGCMANPFIWGDTVVWVEESGDYDGPGEPIWAYNLVTKESSMVATSGACSPMPELFEDKLIYKDNLGDGAVITVLNLTTGVKTVVSEGTGCIPRQSPSISGDWAVWHEGSDYWDWDEGYGRVVAYNLATSERKVIASGTAGGCVDVNSGVVVFSDYRNMCGVEDGGDSFELADPVSDEAGCMCEVEESDELAEVASSRGNSDIFGYNLSTDVEFEICTAGGSQYRPRIHEGTVVWVDKRNADETMSDIYGVHLEPMYSQLYGDDRFDTAVESARKSFPDGSDTVIIATGYNWPDALAASSLAGAAGAPVLLARPTSLPAITAQEIDRMGAERAYIIGGPSAISQEIEDDLNVMLSGPVTRIMGDERCATADEIARETVAQLGGTYDGSALVVTSLNYPDALCAAPIAAYDGTPIFLAGSAGMAESTMATMEDLGVTDVTIAGGVKAVSAATAVQLSAKFTVDRVGGPTRYHTAAMMAQVSVDDVGLMWDGVAYATGRDFPDALTGGVMQGRLGSALLLTPSYYLHTAPKAKTQIYKGEIARVKFLGGDSAISESVRDEVKAILEN